MPDYVILGTDVETRKKIPISDIERRSGLYILGRPGSGKTTLMKNIIAQDIVNDHGIFFLDPHGDAIEDLLQRIPAKRQDDVFVIDPTDESYAFGMNLLACSDITSFNEREKTFDRAIGIFTKLFANPQTGILDVLLDKYLRNSFYPLIINQGYTIAEIPLVLNDKQFRDHLLQHPLIAEDYPEVARFWHTEFSQLSPNDQRTEIQSTLTRLGSFTRPYIKHIVGQNQTGLDFTDIMNTGKIVFVKLSSNLSDDHKRIIGTILVSHLVSAVFQRDKMPEAQRRHFCIFIDEFQNFAGSEDFAILFTQGRKFAVATTIAHQERFGQFADNKAILGATDAAGNKIFFHPAVKDADEQAPEVTKTSPTEIRLERHLGISQEPFTDLLRGHKHPDIHRFVDKYLRPLQHKLEDTREDIEYERLLRLALLDEAALSRVDERYESIEASAVRGRDIPVSHEALHHTGEVLGQVQERTERLIRLHENARDLRLSLRSLNTFLTAIMEGRLVPEPGQELFSHFLLAFVPLVAPLPLARTSAFTLYVSLVYGRPALPRAIPMTLAAKCKMASHEELYRETEAQYTRQVHSSLERVRRDAEEARADRRQDEYEYMLVYIMTWKCRIGGSNVMLDGPRLRELFQLLLHRQVRTLLMPYFFATFAPPWYYDDRYPLGLGGRDSLEEGESVSVFIRQYGEGAWVTLTLLYMATYGGWGVGTRSSEAPPDGKPIWLYKFYQNLHMLEIPAIIGKEPYAVLQLYNQLFATLDKVRGQQRSIITIGTSRNDFDFRPEAKLLRGVLQKREANALPNTWWSTLDKGTREYLIFRACDLVTFGDVVADRTFPQPTLPGATPVQVSAVVTALMILLMEAQGKADERRDQEWESYKEAFVRDCLWKYDGLLHLQVYQAEGRVHMRHTVERYLPARILTPEERKTLTDACLTELPKSVLATLNDFVTFCQLLRQRENHVRSETGQYVEKEVNTYTTAEMRNQMVQELINLDPHYAYVTSTFTGKIQTLDVSAEPGALLSSGRGDLVDVRGTARNNALSAGILRQRGEIEEEIRMRQDNWRKRPGNEPPPPTSTGGNTPPSLPSASAGSDSEPPPTNTTSEETAGNSDITQPRTGITARGGASGSQEGKVIAFSSYQDKRIELELVTSIKSPDTPPDEPIPSRLSPVPDLQTKQAPALEFVSLKFFESGTGYPRKEQRRYSTSFPQSTARFVNFEFNVRNLLYRQRNQTHDMWVGIYNPNGGLLWQDQHDWDIEADCEHTWHTWGWGNAEPGRHWAGGKYRVVILMDGVECAEGSFTITDSEEPPLKQGLALELESLRFFESGQGLLATEQRQYSTSFQQQTARCICFELTMRNMLYRQRDKRYLVKTRYVKPDGSDLMRHRDETVVHSDNEWSSYRWGFGAVKPGFWTPGTYRVVILINGVEFAEGSFVIE